MHSLRNANLKSKEEMKEFLDSGRSLYRRDLEYTVDHSRVFSGETPYYCKQNGFYVFSLSGTSWDLYAEMEVELTTEEYNEEVIKELKRGKTPIVCLCCDDFSSESYQPLRFVVEYDAEQKLFIDTNGICWKDVKKVIQK